jgi:hypothetical protein
LNTTIPSCYIADRLVELIHPAKPQASGPLVSFFHAPVGIYVAGVIALLIFFVIAVPAVWSRSADRREAAAEVLRILLRWWTPITTLAHDVEAAGPGEICRFHPGCCGVDDVGCPGCGAQASITLVFARPDGGAERVPVCADHEKPTADALVAASRALGSASN